YELELATARGAQQAGAPLFAANVLAGVAGRVPAHALPQHLLWTAELYVEGGDRIRAGVIHEFARARAGKRGLQGARWAAVARALAPETPSARPERSGATAKNERATPIPRSVANLIASPGPTPTSNPSVHP